MGLMEAGTGNELTVRLVRHSQRKRGATDRLNLWSIAPVLDPTAGSRQTTFEINLPARPLEGSAKAYLAHSGQFTMRSMPCQDPGGAGYSTFRSHIAKTIYKMVMRT